MSLETHVRQPGTNEIQSYLERNSTYREALGRLSLEEADFGASFDEELRRILARRRVAAQGEPRYRVI